MKKYLVALLLLPLAATAVDESSLAFGDQKIGSLSLSLLGESTQSLIGLPSLTLVGKSIQPLPALLNDAAGWFRSQSPHTLAPKKFVSHMPIVSPKAGVDSRMPIKIPDASTDYKLIVVAPTVEPAK